LVAGANNNEGIMHEQRNQYRSQKGGKKASLQSTASKLAHRKAK